jgi:hypothetical protein
LPHGYEKYKTSKCERGGNLLMKKKEYVYFEFARAKPRTKVYYVKSKSDDKILGEIYWWSPWRQYIFDPWSSTIYSRGCMKQIIEFIQKLMDERKK